MAASFSLLSSVLSKIMLVAAQKRVYTNTLVSQVNKKNNDLDFGPYLMGFPHGLRKTNPTISSRFVSFPIRWIRMLIKKDR